MDGQLGSCEERHACLKVFGEETHTERLLTGVELHKLVATPYGQRNSVDGEGEGLMTSHECHV